jgi:hypothetical protein
MAFSLVVEMLNIRMRKRAAQRRPTQLRSPYAAEAGTETTPR